MGNILFKSNNKKNEINLNNSFFQTNESVRHNSLESTNSLKNNNNDLIEVSLHEEEIIKVHVENLVKEIK